MICNIPVRLMRRGQEADRVVQVPIRRGRRQVRGVRSDPGKKRRMIRTLRENVLNERDRFVPSDGGRVIRRASIVGPHVRFPAIHRCCAFRPLRLIEVDAAHDALRIDAGRERELDVWW